MANQSMMVPPNNAPWPGLQAPPHSQPPTSPTYSHTHHAHTSSYPLPPSPYYPHPPPPPHHPHHGPPPPPPHHYPYHPYAAPYPPPYGPAHSSSLPTYHHGPPHHAAPPQHASHDPSLTAATGGETLSGSILSSSSGAGKAIKAKPALTTVTTKTKTGKVAGSSESSDSAANGSSTTTTSTSTPGTKTFRFEGSISSETFKTTKSFDLAGVNILNRKPLDARTALDKLQRRRETHNRVERKRRDCINQLIDDLTKLLPPKHLEEASSKCHRVNVLRGAVAHIKFLSDSNNGLTKTLDAAKNEGFKIPEISDVVPAEATAAASADNASTDNSTVDQQAMSMDVDMEDDAQEDSVKQEVTDDDEVQMKDASDNNTPRTTSPGAASPSSASPRLTPSKILGQPQLIITNAPSPKTEHSSREGFVPPPISISSAPVDPYSLESHPPNGSSIGESITPVNPAFPNSPKSNPTTASSSPSARQGSFQAKDNSKQLLQQQLSPFLQTISLSTSPSLPPISSLANLKIQSPSARIEGHSSGERHFEERPSSPTLRSTAAPPANSNKGNGGTHQRNGPTLPPLKIPAPQHLHPSYKQGGGAPSTLDSRASNRSAPTLSPHQHATSPHHHQRGSEGGDHQHPQQPPVSPFMLSPLMSRSPSMGPLSASSAGTAPYPHWGHEGPDGAPPPPPHQGQYLPPHGYPHGYPYPYPYHPSYGYHHPPPPHHHPHPHHHHHAPPSPHSPQHRPTSPHHPAAVVTASRPAPPEPIFIQEEPWNVQRKRSTSNTASGKSQSGKQQNGIAAAKRAKEGSVIREQSATPVPVSPTSSVASSAPSYPSPNSHRKRPSSSSHNPSQDHHRKNSQGESVKGDGTVVKRVRQHEDSSSTSPRLESNQNGQEHRQGASDQQQQRDSGIVVVVVKADDEDSHHQYHRQQHQQPPSPATSSHHDEIMTVDQSGSHHNHRDAAQALTSLSQNA
ncbi:hypothetical protein BGZ95_008941 [Linnemannia exigua]|uniref:BHLH domain-containing protein n=1 Tax=Linnemannia exigua TaxID=604196 RepID=A0AAD4H7F8_9FUNG|nr:hypothetical protein BGZ95_008941 [Linnemannia exigua]